MKQEEAIKLVMSKYPKHDIGQVTETDDYFVINIVPKNSKTDTINPPICDNSLKAVNKETKSIFTYNPIIHG